MFYPDETNFEVYVTGAFNLTIVTEATSNVNDNVSTTFDTNATGLEYDPQVCSGSSEEFISTLIFQSCVYVLYSTVFVVALAGNGLVCFVVHTSPRMKTVTNYFIVNLAVGDILMTLLCVPFTFVPMLVLHYWPFGALMCKIVNYSQAVSVFVSAYTLLAISIDRYMAIMRPLQPRLGKTHAKLVVAAVWAGALATAAPIAVVSQLKRPSNWHQYCQRDICLENWDRTEQSEQYTYALLILQFVLPFCALVCTYTRIAVAVWGGRPPGEAETTRDSRLQRSKRKMIKMMVTVVVVFTFCWLPLNIFIILWIIHANDESWGYWPGMQYVFFAAHWLAMSHTCYNPIIYCYMNARYRRGFKQVLCCLLRTRFDSRSYRRSTSMCEGVPMSGSSDYTACRLAQLNTAGTHYVHRCTRTMKFAGSSDYTACRLAQLNTAGTHYVHRCTRTMKFAEMVGINGMTRRGTVSSSVGRLQRAPTCSTSCSSSRAHAARPIARPPAPAATPPARALSVRTDFHSQFN